MGLTSEGVPFNSGLYCKMTCQVLWRHFWLDWRWHVCRQDSVESVGYLPLQWPSKGSAGWDVCSYMVVVWMEVACLLFLLPWWMGFYSNNETIIASYHHQKKNRHSKGTFLFIIPHAQTRCVTVALPGQDCVCLKIFLVLGLKDRYELFKLLHISTDTEDV